MIEWMSTEEIEAELEFKESADLTEAFRRVRDKMAERSCSEEAERERHRDAVALADALRQPVLYSSR
jgi:hypothetical protein